MQPVINSVLDAGKQKTRAEISNHVEEFLQRGGKIEVVENAVTYQRNDLLKGGAGHDLDFAPIAED